MKKKSERFKWFLTQKIHFESSISALCDELAEVGKVSQDAYNPELWLILCDLLKNWVAEGVGSDINEFTIVSCIA